MPFWINVIEYIAQTHTSHLLTIKGKITAANIIIMCGTMNIMSEYENRSQANGHYKGSTQRNFCIYYYFRMYPYIAYLYATQNIIYVDLI